MNRSPWVRRPMLRRFVLFGLPVIVALAASFGPALARDDAPAPVDITSDATPSGSVDGLVRASDAVVLAEVLDTADGRTITDPSSPTTGIRTQMADLRVVEVLAGEAPERLVLEEAATLLDGAALRVDGAAPVVPGDRGVFFLVAGRSEAEPHWASIGAGGRFLVRGETLEAGAADDPLATQLAAAGGPALVDAVRAAAARHP